MPRKTKDADEKTNSKKVTDLAKKSTTNKKATETKKTANKSTAKDEAKSKNTIKKDTTSKKRTTSKSKKVSISKSKEPKKTSKTVSTKKASNKVVANIFAPEYYDLPFRYNQTVVEILAQTPSALFVYWDISDTDRQNLKNKFGEYFFHITKPVLIVYNTTLNYSFEVDINDFANSWYLHINDSDCNYKIELIRKPIPVNYNYIPEYNIEKNGPIKPIEIPSIYISSSNDIVSPNDKILNNLGQKILFRNIKTNELIERDISEFSFIGQNSSFVSIYSLYKDLFKDEYMYLNNPSSGNPSSGSLSSFFK